MEKRTRSDFWGGVAAVAVMTVLVFGGLSLMTRNASAGQQKTKEAGITAPKGREMATFAAGCFWSMEAIFKQLKGVDKAEPGYAGGTIASPSYEVVETGRTGHAETLNITYDPKVISYRDLLKVLLTVRNPTTVNKQGPDEGPQYRSIIFYRSAAQKKAAEEVIQETNKAHIWNALIVTEVKPFAKFYRAEDYHLDYYNLHTSEPYCRMVVAPEIAEFREKFAKLLKK